MATIFELKAERKRIHEQMKGLLDAAEAENRPLNAEENQTYERLEADLEAKGDEVEAHERDIRRRQQVAGVVMDEPRNPTAHQPQPGGKKDEARESVWAVLERAVEMGASRREALREAVKSHGPSPEERAAMGDFLRFGLRSPLLEERGALQMDVPGSGGTLVMPEAFIAQLIMGLDEMVFMRRISTVLPLTQAESIGVPSLENDPADADWTSELAIGGEDTTMSVGKRNLFPHPLGKLMKVSDTLLRRSAIPVDGLVRNRLGFKFAVTMEKAYLTGNGAQQPLGVMTASANGISTGQDMATDNTTTAITADGLINAKYNLASQYLMSANLNWIFHRTAVRNIRKLKDGNGQYLWSAGLSGTPDTILDTPYFMSEYQSSTFTAALYVGIIGDFSWYWIADALQFRLQRLNELYAATNQVGFIGRLESDGLPVLEEAFTRVQIGS
jgi:HK97 family phage major capsid protein